MLTIVVITYNIHSEIFLMQIEAIRKYCQDEFVIEIIDNSSKPDCAEAIRYHSGVLGLNYLKTFAIALDGSSSHAFAANFSYQKFRDSGSTHYLYLDHDCIPVKPFSVEEILGEDKVMAGIGQEKVSKKIYFWQGCVMWDNTKIDNDLLDFSPNTQLGLDTGGNLYRVIEKYGMESCIFFNEQYCETEYHGSRYNYYALINDGMFLHCVALSGWNEGGINLERVNLMINIVRGKLDSYVD